MSDEKVKRLEKQVEKLKEQLRKAKQDSYGEFMYQRYIDLITIQALSAGEALPALVARQLATVNLNRGSWQVTPHAASIEVPAVKLVFGMEALGEPYASMSFVEREAYFNEGRTDAR